MPELTTRSTDNLQELLQAAGQPPLDSETADWFEQYLSLLMRWNAKTNLTSVRDRQGILSRHFVESIVCARGLPAGIETLLDFGSGAGFPGVPIALCRPEIAVTLAESQGKKAAFLQEVARVLRIPVRVHATRAQTLSTKFNCITLRAVDDMSEAVHSALELLEPQGWLVLLSTEQGMNKASQAAGSALSDFTTKMLPASDRRILAIAKLV